MKKQWAILLGQTLFVVSKENLILFGFNSYFTAEKAHHHGRHQGRCNNSLALMSLKLAAFSVPLLVWYSRLYVGPFAHCRNLKDLSRERGALLYFQANDTHACLSVVQRIKLPSFLL